MTRSLCCRGTHKFETLQGPFWISGLQVDWQESDFQKRILNVPQELYEKGCVTDVDHGLRVGLASQILFVFQSFNFWQSSHQRLHFHLNQGWAQILSWTEIRHKPGLAHGSQALVHAIASPTILRFFAEVHELPPAVFLSTCIKNNPIFKKEMACLVNWWSILSWSSGL